MARNFSKQLAGQIGESVVVAELGRRGIVATALAGNVPDIDLLAYKGGKTSALQVKAWHRGAVCINATRFLNIDIVNGFQRVIGPNEDLDPNLIFIFVLIGEKAAADRFFLMTQNELQSLIQQAYKSFLDKHDSKRPRNAQTTHHSVTLAQLKAYEDNWVLVEQVFG